jgi:hypothetical protein
MSLVQAKLARGVIEERYLSLDADSETTAVCDLSSKGLIHSQRRSLGQ